MPRRTPQRNPEPRLDDRREDGTASTSSPSDRPTSGRRTSPTRFRAIRERANFKLTNVSLDNSVADRMNDRLLLQKGFDKVRRSVDASGMMDAMDDFNRRAIEMITTSRMRDAFDLSKEPDAIRERYGRHACGTPGSRGSAAR